MRILSGDIGGTKTRIALIETASKPLSIYSEKTFISNNFSGLQDIIARFLAIEKVRPEAVGLGVAGPVRQQKTVATNLPWIIDAQSLAYNLALPSVYLLNDLEATAWGVQALSATDITEIHPGRPDPHGNQSVIALGTGLGEAGIYRQNGGFHPFASEGGHADFSATDELECALLKFFTRRYGHVSWERVVSGLGLPDILAFLCEHQEKTLPQSAQMELAHAGGALIAAAADAGDYLCEQAMRLFVRLYAREAGNHALKVMATGGVYLAGGITPKIIARLRAPTFLDTFFDKGRMRPLMQDMPVWVVLNDRAALYGAALATDHYWQSR